MPERRLDLIGECLATLYRHYPAVLAANLINGLLLSAALWNRVSELRLLGWLGAVVVLTGLRGAFVLLYRKKRPAGRSVESWIALSSVGSALSGLLWGSAAPLFLTGTDPMVFIAVTFVISGMAAGAVTSLSSHLPSFFLYLVCSVLPLEASLTSRGDMTSLALAGMTLVFASGMGFIGVSINRWLLRAMELNRDNQRLLSGMEDQVADRTVKLADEIAERKAMEGALVAARAEAERANQAKSRFLAAASHDLRQPMQSLFLFVQALGTHVPKGRGRDILTMIERSLDVQKGLLDSLLDISRLDVNLIHPQIQRFELAPLLADIAAAYRPIAAGKGLDFRLADIPGMFVASDPTLLGRMIRNLVENAIRYTDQGHILLAARPLGPNVMIEVGDTGIGIPEEEMTLIFEEFHQVGNPERDKTRGLGLGLAIVQRLARILGHPIEVRSELGKGSTFLLTLPSECGDTQITVERQAPEIKGWSARTILVIEDDPMVKEALSAVIAAWGHKVLTASGADEAIDKLDKAGLAPDLAMVDYRLSGGALGIEALALLRSRFGNELPGILLTGDTGQEARDAAATLGITMLVKPIMAERLKVAFDTALSLLPVGAADVSASD